MFNWYGNWYWDWRHPWFSLKNAILKATYDPLKRAELDIYLKMHEQMYRRR